MNNTGSVARMQAYALIKRMVRPETVTKHQWTKVIALLYLIARHYPHCYLGQEKIAEKLGWSVRSVERYVGMARDLGVIQVTPDAGTKRRGGHSYTNLYHIIEQVDMPPTWRGPHAANLADKGTVGRPSLPFPQEAPTERELRSLSFVAPDGPPGRPATVTKVPRLSASEALAAANERGHIKARPKSKDPDPARRLTAYFADQWEIHGRDDVRPLEAIGEVTGYIRTTFLTPAAGKRYTEDEVRAFIDQFMLAVVRRQVQMKDGQSAWRRFTGWWGRRKERPDSGTLINEYFGSKGA